MLCQICVETLNSSQFLRLHQTLKSYLSLQCKICGKKYATRTRVKNHESSHVKKATCEVCGKQFVHKHSLERHSIVHTGEKPYQCSICGLRVSQSSALKRHMDKVHPGGIAGKPRSTKARKCRTLAQDREEKTKGGQQQAAPSAKRRKTEESSERPQKAPARAKSKKRTASELSVSLQLLTQSRRYLDLRLLKLKFSPHQSCF